MVNATAAIGMKDKSRALLPWQAGVISYVVGEHVQRLISSLPDPGVSFRMTDQAHANMAQGLRDLQRTCLTATDEVRDRAGDEGAVIHRYIEDYFKAKLAGEKSPPALRGVSPKGRQAIRQFAAWVVDNDVEPIALERPIFSKHLFYAGQLDLLLKVNGEVGVWDIKSGKDVYSDVTLQTAAYRMAWNEEVEFTEDHPENLATAPGGVLFFERDDISPIQKELTGNFEVVPFEHEQILEAGIVFSHLLAVKKWDGKAWKQMKDLRAKAREAA